ncbi:MAG: hypothetical protein LBN18_08570 [Dysgonamonadaceae bacterium]|nr:hypothetical protein [Dysgonamonadaceae bacterium]
MIFEFSTDSSNYAYLTVSVNAGSEWKFFSAIYVPIGSNPYRIKFDLSEIVKTFLPLPQLEDVDVITANVIDFITDYSIELEQDDAVYNFDGKVLPGGVSKKMLRYLQENNTDIFAFKYQNFSRNFFLTTRSDGRHIVLKESELTPFYFIGSQNTITILTDQERTYVLSSIDESNVYALDLNVLRKLNFYIYNEMPVYFAVLVNGDFVFDITLLKSSLSSNRQVIEFLNSLHVPERIEITGKPISEPEFDELLPFNTYDNRIDDYLEAHDRRAITEVIHAEAGYKSIQEFHFIRDMLQSSEQFLVKNDGKKLPVIISCDSFKHDMIPVAPGSVPLTIRSIEKEINYSPEVDLSDVLHFREEWFKNGYLNAMGLIYASSLIYSPNI